ncbi:UDP-N-acetylmuramoyl-L-alanine--D-glutamate ligase [Candidatus Roizmanbacteria bacterium CG06_land_8_20_14_3_00_34_14]|uniref:UDP-N-acetylmuramoylalanine--D-glutamate ligase n=2 Tax=Candidatus Roizmaniibacteriota TaxID=1752723 RepID=A0A2M7AVY7_9BACT|nr:MAG: UDP-N-acetylmuramoyl-L-alanine--D-glutamate ligase [Candidatus Roizmanbacteria bacterium CG07_land_8_20_14_0_80_34_15]PIU74713.1 MAG: UDP-N-acetylmuramoyl-L-alanine--D-glutamate ligase [Candidatus Roizmanbacteria bacterium CG06_land_8_20_14_3_00_34_14]
MKIEELKNYKRILILGYGKEGQATERFLRKFVPLTELGIADKKDSANYLDEQEKYDLIIRSPGIPKKLITRPYTTASNIFLANIDNVVIGVTGTKGKSTTVSLIYSILKEAGKKAFLIGNIGKPMLDEMLKPIGKEDIFVCEFSSYQLDDIKYSPHISVVLDLFPEHMNYHGDVQNYYNAKKNIIAQVAADDYFIYNPKFTDLKSWADNSHCKNIPFEQNILIRDEDIPLIGNHNKENIKAAITVAHLLDIDNNTIVKAIKEFKPLPHRLELIGKFKEIIFYDDAISTTPQSTILAIESLKNVGTIFLGGTDRGYDFNKMVEVIIEYKIPNIVLFPESGDVISKIIKSKKAEYLHIFNTKSMEEAVKFAYEHTPKNKICLLSNASPSYSLWKNFEEKGDLFRSFVKKYK